MDGPLQAGPQQATAANGPTKKRKKRVRNFTPDDRAAHREFEKSRRIAFNQRLLELASLLPGLETARLSKHIIVDESISQHRVQRESCERATREIQLLQTERDELISEVNALRASYLPGPVNLRQPRPVDVGLLQALNIPPGTPVDARGLQESGDLPQGSSRNPEPNGHPVPHPPTSMEGPVPITAESGSHSIPLATTSAGIPPEAFSIPSSANSVPTPFFISAPLSTLAGRPSDETASSNPPLPAALPDGANEASHFPQPVLNQRTTSLESPAAGVLESSEARLITNADQPPPISSEIDFNWQLDPSDLFDIPPDNFLSSSYLDDSHDSHPLPRTTSQHIPVMIPEAHQAWDT